MVPDDGNLMVGQHLAGYSLLDILEELPCSRSRIGGLVDGLARREII